MVGVSNATVSMSTIYSRHQQGYKIVYNIIYDIFYDFMQYKKL